VKLVEFYAGKEAVLREKLDGDRKGLETAIRQAAANGDMEAVDRLRPELDAVNDDIALMNVVQLRAIVESRIQFPELPPDYAQALERGQAELERWQRLERAVQTTIAVAGQVAEGVSTMAKLFLKYGKYLV
jgi:hypothetical protein